ncbi:FAD/FMN-containing dehydrogenase [Chitinivorax tropicus]|uniref:FAD/FMN-containing dehydrogenase n=2 Tax=Chitinivorax tropicus TaxID=714531 RepID=A0A840MTZ3_9PROT|nr:FAD/FMN-containing dehydrogenase [Chitinivorax tropicus]
METFQLISALQHLLGDAHVLLDDVQKAPFCIDQRRRYQGNALAVIQPATVAEICQVVRLAAAAGVSIVPQGGNTGLVGGATPVSMGRPSLVLSLARMNQIRQWHGDGVTVEAGVILAELNRLAGGRGQYLPIDLASSGSAQIGGVISTNAGGMRVIRHGMLRQHVLGLEVVLANGEVWSDLRPLLKNNCGYDLKQLFIGAEGTLGIVTAATLRLVPTPIQQATAWVALPDMAAALELLGALRQSAGDALTAFEVINHNCIELVAKHAPDLAWPLPGEHADWYALVELSASHQAIDLHTMLLDCLAGLGVQRAVVAQSQAQTDTLWRWRELIPEAQRLAGGNIKHDIAVPHDALPVFVSRAEQALKDRFPEVAIIAFGHAGDGNLHYNVAHTRSSAADTFLDEAEVNGLIYDLVKACGGTCSAEHGIGQLKRDRLRDWAGPTGWQLMQQIKSSLDPDGVFNPGKVL